MANQEDHRLRSLRRAVEVAILEGRLPPHAESWRTVVLLEELADALGFSRTSLRNLYYRDDSRLIEELETYVSSNRAHLLTGLRAHNYVDLNPIVWKRSLAEAQSTQRNLPSAIVLLEAAMELLRNDSSLQNSFRREIGGLAAEIMASALSFFENNRRANLLNRAERVFLEAMGPLSLQHETPPNDAAIFARFWENRATVCGMEWSNIWDDPDMPAPVSEETVRLAISELDHASTWQTQHGTPDNNDRRRQLIADKAKWLAKVGQFNKAENLLTDLLAEEETLAISMDLHLIRCLRNIISRQLTDATRDAAALTELVEAENGRDSYGSASALILQHHIALLDDKHPEIPDAAINFMLESPVAVSEFVNLGRYKHRLRSLGYSIAQPRRQLTTALE